MNASKIISNGINLLAAIAALYVSLFYLPRGWEGFTPPLIPWLLYMLLPYITFGLLSLMFQKKSASNERNIFFIIIAVALMCTTVLSYILLANESMMMIYLKQLLTIIPIVSVVAFLLLFALRSYLISRAKRYAQIHDKDNAETTDEDNTELSGADNTEPSGADNTEPSDEENIELLEPSSTNQSDIDNFRQWVSESMKKIPSELGAQKDLFICFNSKGKKPPIYWCFNSWTEAILLAKQLGPNQPLFAMHSFYGFFKSASYKKIHTISLGQIYGELLLQHHRTGPIFIGGNCQAGPISEATAHFLLSKTEITPVLITLEHQPFYSYPGSVVMLFGRRSEKYNPFLGDIDPIPSWKIKYTNASWATIDGDHGEYFFEPSVFEIADHLNSVIDNFSNGVQPGNGPLKIEKSKTVT